MKKPHLNSNAAKELRPELAQAMSRIAELEDKLLSQSPGSEHPSLPISLFDHMRKKFFDDAPIGVFHSTPDGRYLFANSYLAKLLGYASPKVLVEDIQSIGKQAYFNPGDYGHLLRLAAKNGAVKNYESRQKSRQGAVIWTSTSIRAVKNDKGELDHFEGFVTDISERKQAEKNLHENEELFRELVEHLREVFIIQDVCSRKILYVSPMYEEVFGRSSESLLRDSATFLQAVHPDDWKYVRLAYLKLEHQAVPLDEEYRILLPDGRQRWIRSLAFCILDARNQPYRIVSMSEDITQWKEHKVALQQAKLKAERASQAKSEFLAAMSHEVRTPLNGLLGVLQLIRTTPLNTEQDRYINMAINSSRNLLRILSDILDLSKIETGSLNLVSEPFSLESVLEPVFVVFKGETKAKGVTFNVNISSDLPISLIGDPQRLRQVLFNLMENSVKYTESGKIEVEVYSLPREKDDKRIRIHFIIRDTGIGIEDRQLDIMFNEFTLDGSTYSRQHGRAGLGLAIVRKLVNIMGGSLAIASEPGEGTEVHLDLPLDIARDKEKMGKPSLLALPHPGQRTLLVVEDDSVNRLALTYFVNKLGYDSLVAENGRHALELLRSSKVDGVIMDIQMPEMDGVEATRRIRKGEAGRSDMPIIAVTAYAMKGDRESFLEAGMNDYLAKPVELEDLDRALKKALTAAA